MENVRHTPLLANSKLIRLGMSPLSSRRWWTSIREGRIALSDGRTYLSVEVMSAKLVVGISSADSCGLNVRFPSVGRESTSLVLSGLLALNTNLCKLAYLVQCRGSSTSWCRVT